MCMTSHTHMGLMDLFLLLLFSLGAGPHRIHLHRDHHVVFSLWRSVLLWVCQLQCCRGDRSPPPDLQPQPAHQGAPHQLEPHGRYRRTRDRYILLTFGQNLPDKGFDKIPRRTGHGSATGVCHAEEEVPPPGCIVPNDDRSKFLWYSFAQPYGKPHDDW